MKIVHVTPSYAPCIGGAEKLLQATSERLASRGHEVTIFSMNVSKQPHFSTQMGSGLPEREMMNAVTVRRFLPNGDVWSWLLHDKWLQLRGGYRSLRFLLPEGELEMLLNGPRPLAMIPAILGAQADIVASMNWLFSPAYYAYLARKLKRFTLVGIPVFHTEQAWSEYPIYSRMLARCDAVLVHTAAEEKFVKERASVEVKIGGGGVEPALFVDRNGEAFRKRHRLGHGPVVGYVGRQDRSKGVLVLLEAMQTVWGWNKETFLILAGPQAHRDRTVEAAIQTLPPSQRERVTLIDDFQDHEKASIFDSFDVFVLPSMDESFGIVYLEAWMCQKPVIGARIGSTQCVIEEGVDGLLCNPGDAADLAHQIIRILADRGDRERMGKNGYAKTVSRFTWDKITDVWENLYIELAADKKSRVGRRSTRA
ncbi:MAG: glycosyltransferase family 4 protein [Nitrospiraceae bacterium]